jgi:hypothetical protein
VLLFFGMKPWLNFNQQNITIPISLLWIQRMKIMGIVI